MVRMKSTLFSRPGQYPGSARFGEGLEAEGLAEGVGGTLRGLGRARTAGPTAPVVAGAVAPTGVRATTAGVAGAVAEVAAVAVDAAGAALADGVGTRAAVTALEAPAALAVGLSGRRSDASLATATTPTLPPTSAAARTARSTPRDDRGGRGDAVNGADVTPAAASGAAGDPAVVAVPAALRTRAAIASPASRLEIAPCRVLRPAANASASESSSALAKRRAGSRSSARMNHASKGIGRPGMVTDGVGSGDVQIFTSRSPTLSPSNGRTPVTHLKAMTPSDQRSERWSMLRSPRACSGRHVVRRPEHRARLGAARQALLSGGGLDLRDAEVEHLGDLVVVVRRSDEEDVLRLQVAMDDTRVVRALQRAAHVADDPRRLAERKRSEPLDALVERLADEQLHDHVRLARRP